MASRSLGRRASVLIKTATCLSCLGACSAYVTFTAGLLRQLMPAMAEVQQQQHRMPACLPVRPAG